MAIYEHFASVATKRNIHMLGIDLDPALIQRCQESNTHPDNIEFQVADIMKEEHVTDIVSGFLLRYERSRFDLVCCFSVTMWVHINQGDDQFREFLRILSDISSRLILEPQPWKCYKSAVRRMKKLGCDEFEHFKQLKWTQNVDQDILDYMKCECGMDIVDIFGSTEWDRKICLLRQNISKT